MKEFIIQNVDTGKTEIQRANSLLEIKKMIFDQNIKPAFTQEMYSRVRIFDTKSDKPLLQLWV